MSAGRQRGGRADGELLLGVLWALWAWRVELVLLAAAAVLQRAVARETSEVVAVVAIVVGALSAVSAARSRRLLLQWLYRARVRRAWGRAAFDAGVAAEPWSVPSVRSV